MPLALQPAARISGSEGACSGSKPQAPCELQVGTQMPGHEGSTCVVCNLPHACGPSTSLKLQYRPRYTGPCGQVLQAQSALKQVYD